MDKIDVHFFLNNTDTKQRTIVLLDAVNELVERYNEMKEKIQKIIKMNSLAQ